MNLKNMILRKSLTFINLYSSYQEVTEDEITRLTEMISRKKGEIMIPEINKIAKPESGITILQNPE